MSEREGVITFDLDFTPAPPPADGRLAELQGWRTVLRRLGLLGRDPARYQGQGFGNLSCRATGADDDRFLISGTQTGGLELLGAAHWTTVTECRPEANRVAARGPLPPSSEALSHGVLYRADPRIRWVMHLHSPELFAAAGRLGLPVTDPAAPYGSPALAAEIARLAPLAGWPGLLVMGGHEDGILAFGADADAVGGRVVSALAAALAG